MKEERSSLGASGTPACALNTALTSSVQRNKGPSAPYYSEWKEHMLPCSTYFRCGRPPTRRCRRASYRGRATAGLCWSRPTQRHPEVAARPSEEGEHKYRDGRLSQVLNYASDGPVQRQLTEEQKANLGSERNRLECPNPDCSKPDVQVEPDGRAVSSAAASRWRSSCLIPTTRTRRAMLWMTQGRSSKPGCTPPPRRSEPAPRSMRLRTRR